MCLKSREMGPRFQIRKLLVVGVVVAVLEVNALAQGKCD